MAMSASSKMVAPRVNSQRGSMKNAAKVDIAVMVTDKSRFPPNITVQMLDAPPPGDTPEKNIVKFGYKITYKDGLVTSDKETKSHGHIRAKDESQAIRK